MALAAAPAAAETALAQATPKLTLAMSGWTGMIMVAVIVGATRLDLVEAAYTLGARPRGVVPRVLLPSSAPHIAETPRLVLGWAWTCIIVAELVRSSSGMGHMITDAQRLLDTGQMIFGIVMIGLIGLVSDYGFKRANRRLFPWFAIA